MNKQKEKSSAHVQANNRNGDLHPKIEEKYKEGSHDQENEI